MVVRTVRVSGGGDQQQTIVVDHHQINKIN